MRTAVEVRRKEKVRLRQVHSLRAESQNKDMGVGGREGRHYSCNETQLRSLLDASFPNPAASSQLAGQATSCGEEGDEDVGILALSASRSLT